VESVRALNDSERLGRQWELVKAAMRRIGRPCSRQEIAKELHWETSTVCARIHELVAADEVAEAGMKIGDSGRRQKLLTLTLKAQHVGGTTPAGNGVQG
jgi:hypothetical protein